MPQGSGEHSLSTVVLMEHFFQGTRDIETLLLCYLLGHEKIKKKKTKFNSRWVYTYNIIVIELEFNKTDHFKGGEGRETVKINEKLI